MPLTKSTVFDTYSKAYGHHRDVVLAVTHSGTTYYFSQRPMPKGLNTNPVYPLLLSQSKQKEGFDIFTKKYKVSNITFILSDHKFYPQTDTKPIRVSELLENINGSVCKLYQWVDGITDIADCLLIFDGQTLQALDVSNHRAKFTAYSKIKLWDKSIPDRQVKDEYSDAPEETKNDFIPIVYGEFSGFDDTRDLATANGLAKAIAFEDSLRTKHIVADHIIHSFNVSGMRNSGAPSLLVYGQEAQNTDDNGVAWQQLKLGEASITFDLTEILPNIYNDENFIESLTDRENLSDDNSFTRCNFSDRLSDDGSFVVGLALMGIKNANLLQSHLSAGGNITALYRDLDADGAFAQAKITALESYLYHGVDGATDFNTLLGRSTVDGAGGLDGILNYDSGVHTMGTRSITNSDLTSNEFIGAKFALSIKTFALDSSIADGVVNNQNICSLSDFFIIYKTNILFFQPYIWLAVSGKTYGTVLTSGRSNSYSAGAVIQDGAFIIEELYRSYIGLSTSDIDTDSFDNSASAAVLTRIQLLTPRLVSDIVRSISEQCRIVVFGTAAGKLRCINLFDKTPTIENTITRNQLIGDDFSLSKTKYIVNKLTINSRWQGEYSSFKDTIVQEDATSQTDVLVREAFFDWPNINGNSVAVTASNYVNTTDGVLSKEHVQVEFSTHGFTHSYLQPGDWIQFDLDIDDIRTAYGTSWNNLNLLVVNTEKHLDKTKIVAIELYR